MSTTLTAMLFSGSRIGMVHIGDSRAYMLRDGEFNQLTKDDTVVQALIDEGRMRLEQARIHPERHHLYRALDGRDAEPEYSVREARPGDRYVLCSKGLSGVVNVDLIAETVRAYGDAGMCADRLVQLALRGGGPDNLSVIVADVTTEPIPARAGAAEAIYARKLPPAAAVPPPSPPHKPAVRAPHVEASTLNVVRWLVMLAVVTCGTATVMQGLAWANGVIVALGATIGTVLPAAVFRGMQLGYRIDTPGTTQRRVRRRDPLIGRLLILCGLSLLTAWGAAVVVFAFDDTTHMSTWLRLVADIRRYAWGIGVPAVLSGVVVIRHSRALRRAAARDAMYGRGTRASVPR
jgi:hypothetical protein